PLDHAERADLVTVVQEEADRLNRLVGEATEMAQLDAHQVHLEFEVQDIRGPIDVAVKDLAPVLADHELDVSFAPDLPRISMDKERIAEVLRHLLENAGKYSPAGSPIHVTAEARGATVRVSVAD